MKRETLFLKAAVCVIGAPVLALCIFALPRIASETDADYPKSVVLPIVIGLYAAAIPFYLVLFQAFKLLGYIDKDKAFSELSVVALKRIKYCAVAVGVLLAACLPFIYRVADRDDAPGMILMWAALAGAPLVIAVFAAVLEKLLRRAIDIKSENDLTV